VLKLQRHSVVSHRAFKMHPSLPPLSLSLSLSLIATRRSVRSIRYTPYTRMSVKDTSYSSSESPEGRKGGRRLRSVSLRLPSHTCVRASVYVRSRARARVCLFLIALDVGTRAAAYLYELSYRRLKWSEPYPLSTSRLTTRR